MNTDQPEEFEEVNVGVEAVLDDLQPLWGQGTHGVSDGVESSTTGEHQEPFQQPDAAGYLLQAQVWDPEGKLGKR